MLRIELLGRFAVASDEGAVDEAAWRLRKARSLLKLLALAPDHRLHREQVLEALWPDRDASAAANNLRQAVFVARRALESCGDAGAHRLALGRDVVELSDAGGLWVDVEAFEAAATAAAGSDDIGLHRAAIERYAGELLPEDRFEPWAAARRDALRERQLELLTALAGLHETAGDPAAAIVALQQALTEEPLHERAHRELMRLYALTGRRQRALAQYHLLRESLRREFEDEPDDATRRLYRDVLTRRLGSGDSPEPAPARRPATPNVPGNLPIQLTSFVGRERELREIAGLLGRTRLLTLTGPGGCGKSRLALEAAAGMLREFADGVWLVELAGLSGDELVAHAAAAALGAESRSGRAPDDAVAAHVGDRRLLLVLDTCEHVIDACARLAQRLLTCCPRLVVLATSREPLHVPGEVSWRVPSLSPPEAVRLFAERAADVAPRFELAANTTAVAEICRRLDGIPLAIELGAARMSVLTAGQIAERLRDSLTVLAAGGRVALTRQQTLTATIDWSHDLLDGDERTLLRRLGVFAGGCSLDAVEVVCDGELDVLGRLVDKSLVIVDEDAGEARYRLLDSVAQYARERLDEAGETAPVEARHRAYVLALAEAAGPALLEREDDNLRAALRSALRDDPAVAVRLAAALWRYWHDRGDRVEGANWLEAAVRAAPAPTLPLARALLGLSVLSMRIGTIERARSSAEQAVAVCREIDEPLAAAEALNQLASLHWMRASLADVRRYGAESQALAVRHGSDALAAAVLHTMGVVAGALREPAGREQLDAGIALLRALPADGEPFLLPLAVGLILETPAPGRAPRMLLEETWLPARRVRPGQAVAYALADRAAVARMAGDATAARADLEESLAIVRRLGDGSGVAQLLAQLGNLLSWQGDHELARELHEESLALREAAHDARGIGLCLSDLGLAAERAGDPERAQALLERAHGHFVRTDDRPGSTAVLVHLGYVAHGAGRPVEAIELLERALAVYSGELDTGVCAGWTMVGLAEIDRELGKAERAARRLTDAIPQFLRSGDRNAAACCEQQLSNAALTAR